MLGLITVNLTRRRTRTLLTAVGVAIGVATIVALLAVTDGLRKSASGLIHLGKADFGLFQKSAADPTESVLPDSLVPRVRREPGVVAASPLQLVTDAIPQSPAAIVFGVEPGGFVQGRLVVTHGRHARGAETMVGDLLARQLHYSVGDRITLKGRNFPIVGIYHSGVTFEDQGAILPLAAAQRLKGQEGEATTIAVVVDQRLKLSKVVKTITRDLTGTFAITDPGEAARASANVQLISKAIVVIALIALVTGGIAVTNTMVLSLLERQQELALLAAVGWSPRQVAVLVFGEGVAVSLIGAGLGLALGVAGSYLAVHALSASAFVTPDITAWGLGRGLLVGIAIGVLGGVYPAWRVSRLEPAEVLARG